jgi:hypothetical protein
LKIRKKYRNKEIKFNLKSKIHLDKKNPCLGLLERVNAMDILLDVG